MGDLFSKMPSGEVEVADGVGDLGAGIGEPFEMFEKEDMSDMFRRAMLEKMQLVDDPRPSTSAVSALSCARAASSRRWGTSSTPSALSAPTAGAPSRRGNTRQTPGTGNLIASTALRSSWATLVTPTLPWAERINPQPG